MMSSSITNVAHTNEDNAHHVFQCGSPSLGNDHHPLGRSPERRLKLASEFPWSFHDFKVVLGTMNTLLTNC